MDTYESLSHPKWEYKSHLVFIPKCRPHAVAGLAKVFWAVFQELARHKECKVEDEKLEQMTLRQRIAAEW